MVSLKRNKASQSENQLRWKLIVHYPGKNEITNEENEEVLLVDEFELHKRMKKQPKRKRLKKIRMKRRNLSSFINVFALVITILVHRALV